METNKKSPRLPLPILQRGDRGAAVRTLQLLLVGNGYDCGYHADDGVFGADTQRAIKRFQNDRFLAPSGIVDLESWWAILLAPGYEEVIL